ncbi:MAG: transcriptional regulator [Thermoprotei archaeon]|mgnify:CR=1 FL=1|nr:MAG: transcriptional regulator [Thermoprotei archaeon]RLF03015.1 MAG: transcriptional regulator [Thermoprotei archaeon]
MKSGKGDFPALEIIYDERIIEVAKKIAGDIVFSKNIGKTMKKWRERFQITQMELAEAMGVSPSVISDYESGRRKSPGAHMIRKFVKSLIEIDVRRGKPTLSRLMKMFIEAEGSYKAIIDMREFSEPVTIRNFCQHIDAELVVGEEVKDNVLLGYTVVDSIKVAIDVPAHAYIRLFGTTTQRAAIFTNVRYGRSPLVAVKAFQAGTGLRPALVVLQGPKNVDPLGLIIAKREKIPLALSRIRDLEELVKRLRAI